MFSIWWVRKPCFLKRFIINKETKAGLRPMYFILLLNSLHTSSIIRHFFYCYSFLFSIVTSSKSFIDIYISDVHDDRHKNICHDAQNQYVWRQWDTISHYSRSYFCEQVVVYKQFAVLPAVQLP